MVTGARHSPAPAAIPMKILATRKFAYPLPTAHQIAVIVYRVNAVTYTGRRPYLLMSGIQIRLPRPWNSAVQLKKYAVLEIGLDIPVSFQLGKKSCAVWRIARVGPAARKLHRIMAKQTATAVYSLNHRGLEMHEIQGHVKGNTDEEEMLITN
jgi:hypothetical protein